jgi:hypothetical protein
MALDRREFLGEAVASVDALAPPEQPPRAAIPPAFGAEGDVRIKAGEALEIDELRAP